MARDEMMRRGGGTVEKQKQKQKKKNTNDNNAASELKVFKKSIRALIENPQRCSSGLFREVSSVLWMCREKCACALV